MSLTYRPKRYGPDRGGKAVKPRRAEAGQGRKTGKGEGWENRV